MTTYQNTGTGQPIAMLPPGVIDPNAGDPDWLANTGHILSPADYAMIGGSLGQAGYSQDAISSLMGAIERASLKAAQTAARSVAMEMLPMLTGAIAATHQTAADEIYRQITNQSFGLGGVLAHRKCANIALAVRNQAPRQTPLPIQPILGTLRP